MNPPSRSTRSAKAPHEADSENGNPARNAEHRSETSPKMDDLDELYAPAASFVKLPSTTPHKAPRPSVALPNDRR
jgi:hypothetical protein